MLKRCFQFSSSFLRIVNYFVTKILKRKSFESKKKGAIKTITQFSFQVNFLISHDLACTRSRSKRWTEIFNFFSVWWCIRYLLMMKSIAVNCWHRLAWPEFISRAYYGSFMRTSYKNNFFCLNLGWFLIKAL